MEFYFSDANLNKDRFLKEQISKSEDGCKSGNTVVYNERVGNHSSCTTPGLVENIYMGVYCIIISST